MTIKEQIMKLQTYKMYEGEDTVYVERDDVLKLLEQQTCEDAISKHAVLETIDSRIEQIKRDADEINKSYSHLSFAEGVYNGYCRLKCDLWDLPSVTPKPKMEAEEKPIKINTVDIMKDVINAENIPYEGTDDR